VPSTKLRIAIVGSGDVFYRSYLQPLVALADRVEIVGCCSRTMKSAELAADAVRGWSPAAVAFDDLGEMLDHIRPDAIFNLTPGPAHAAITTACLEAGVHVLSEKPLASTLADADRLIELARSRDRLLLCATASASTRQVRWLHEIIDSGLLGHPTLAVAQIGGMGPAEWREYTGDASVFYHPGVGPIFDIGTYRLHEMTALLGPVRRVQAMGAISIPERPIVAGTRAGETTQVTTPDHVLVNLEFASGTLGQLLATFAMPATQAPWLEIHLTEGTISMAGDQWGTGSPASIFVRPAAVVSVSEESAAAAGVTPFAAPLVEGWNHGLMSPTAPDRFPLIGRGVEHFVACLAGEEQPILTAEHARHVLEIILAAYDSIADGCAVELRTTF
jgi:predicted dehydrogenase